jgi:acetyl esterase/lipase
MTPTVVLRFIVISAALGIAACSPLSVLNAVVSNDTYARTADLPYGQLSRQKLDVYLPVKLLTEAPPVVIFFYGGNWESGNRKDYRFVAEALASRGIVTVVPDYRVYPEVLFPEFVNDGAAATRWVKDNIVRFNGDPRRIFLMGHSAGAHIAALLALDSRYLAGNGLAPAELAGMIGLAGPYDFLPLESATLKVIFGPESERWHSQPINYADGRNPPLLLLTGTDDTTVDPGNTERLASKVRAHGGSVQVRTFGGMGHVGILTRLAAPLQGDGEVVQAIVRFVHQHY